MEKQGEREIVRELIMEEKGRHIQILILLHHFTELTAADLCYALSRRPGTRMTYRYVLGILRELVEMGLVEERILGRLARRRVRVYKLTEKGARVARLLDELTGLAAP